jgi:hypothetical protein
MFRLLQEILSRGGYGFSVPRCSRSKEINNTLHEQNDYNASLAFISTCTIAENKKYTLSYWK